MSRAHELEQEPHIAAIWRSLFCGLSTDVLCGMDGRAAFRAATLVLSGAVAATAALLLLSVVQPQLWQCGPVTSKLVLSQPLRVHHRRDVGKPADDVSANVKTGLDTQQPQPRPQQDTSAVPKPTPEAASSDAPAPLSVPLTAALGPASALAAVAPALGADPRGTTGPAPVAELAADLAASIGVDPDHNTFNTILKVDLTAAAAEARAPVQPDAACLQSGGTVCQSVTRARAILGDRSTGAAGRIFIPLLSGHRERLCCAISNMQKQVFRATPADLFVFSANNSASAFALHRCPGKSKAANIFFMAYDEHWVTPRQAKDRSTWRTTKSENYRRMGNWRLLFQFEFAGHLGYKYLWQTDDDSRLVRPVKFDLAAHMREQGLLMAAHETRHDPASVTAGLPELTGFFLEDEGLAPQTLYSYCRPRDRQGLITADSSGHGWNRTILWGNCVMVDVGFWLQPVVQRYIQLVVSTGAHFRLRWQEQAVQAMVWQVFVPPGNFSLLPIEQRHPSKAC